MHEPKLKKVWNEETLTGSKTKVRTVLFQGVHQEEYHRLTNLGVVDPDGTFPFHYAPVPRKIRMLVDAGIIPR